MKPRPDTPSPVAEATPVESLLRFPCRARVPRITARSSCNTDGGRQSLDQEEIASGFLNHQFKPATQRRAGVVGIVFSQGPSLSSSLSMTSLISPEFIEIGARHNRIDALSYCPPKLGGQRDCEAITRGVVPKPQYNRVSLWNHPGASRHPS